MAFKGYIDRPPLLHSTSKLKSINITLIASYFPHDPRMNKLIMEWPSRELYDNKLTASSRVAEHRLCDLDGVEETENTTSPIIFADTAGLEA